MAKGAAKRESDSILGTGGRWGLAIALALLLDFLAFFLLDASMAVLQQAGQMLAYPGMAVAKKLLSQGPLSGLSLPVAVVLNFFVDLLVLRLLLALFFHRLRETDTAAGPGDASGQETQRRRRPVA